MIKANVTYQVISQESATRGDFEETGFKKQDLEFENETEALEFFSNNYGCYEQGNETSFYTVDPDRDLSSGDETYYGLHLQK
jgi:hypothetical protein